MSERTQATLNLYARLKSEAGAAGYFLNPDLEFTLDLVEGLLTNEARYGYPACPCRLAEGERQADLDIICPCDYRDPDLDEYGACYCALYVSEEIARGQGKPQPVPDRRPAARRQSAHQAVQAGVAPGGMPIWRCQVCGYLCARPQPPLKCPICKVDRDRFERFLME